MEIAQKNEGRICALALDMGGTNLKYACMRPDGTLVGTAGQIPSYSGGDREEILGSWSTVLGEMLSMARHADLSVAGIGVSTPGPFDYANGASRMKHKFQAIFGVRLEEELQRRIILPPGSNMHFLQDANAYLAGEHHFGSAAGYHNCAVATLGTGLGYAAMAEGRLLSNGRGSCYVALYRQPCGDGVLEDIVSARGICRRYGELTQRRDDTPAAHVIAERAREGDAAAEQVFAELGEQLGRGAAFHLVHTAAEVFIIGGQIGKSFALFSKPLKTALYTWGYGGDIRPARFVDDAALYGAATLIFGNE